VETLSLGRGLVPLARGGRGAKESQIVRIPSILLLGALIVAT